MCRRQRDPRTWSDPVGPAAVLAGSMLRGPLPMSFGGSEMAGDARESRVDVEFQRGGVSGSRLAEPALAVGIEGLGEG